MRRVAKHVSFMVTAAFLATGISVAQADPSSEDIVPSNNPDIAGTTTLYRHENGIGMTAWVTGLRGGADFPKGHPYTIWAVIFNAPNECDDSPCTVGDLMAGRGVPAVAQISRNYSDDIGDGHFSGFLEENGALIDASAAEVHFVVRRHPDRNPEYVSLNMVGGNCHPVKGDGPGKNQCEDEGFAIHQPQP